MCHDIKFMDENRARDGKVRGTTKGKKILFISMMAILCLLLTSCSKTSAESGDPIHAQNNADPQGDTPMFIFLNSKCRKAIREAEEFSYWKKEYHKGAQLACSMFDKYLSDNELSYHKLEFMTEPKGSYYFLKAYIEREITLSRPIHTKFGVIEHNTEGALDAFAKEIQVLETTENALQLAQAFHCFHVGDQMDLVTAYQPASWRAEMNEPKFTKNTDGSMTLIYDLIHTGRSLAVKQCMINISKNYKTTLECQEKLNKK